jgi:hypothetical protein
MTDGVRVLLTAVLLLAACVWVGGYVAIGVVARVATRTLEPAARISFFRGLGRSYVRVGTPALLVALGVGAVLVGDRGWDGRATAAAVLAALLLAALAFGVAQARRMTRARTAALSSGSPEFAARVRRGARAATALRAGIGVLTLALVVLGALLAG